MGLTSRVSRVLANSDIMEAGGSIEHLTQQLRNKCKRPADRNSYNREVSMFLLSLSMHVHLSREPRYPLRDRSPDVPWAGTTWQIGSREPEKKEKLFL